MTSYRTIRHRLRSGDLAVLNRPGMVPAMGRGRASHIATVVIREADQRSISLAESREGYGGRVVAFSGEIDRFPGLWDLYTPADACPGTLRERAATVAYNWATGRHGHYDYPGILSKLALRNPLCRLALRAIGHDPDMSDTRPSLWKARKVCSQLHAWAFRYARAELALLDPAWDPCPLLGDRWVEPADLVRAAEAGTYRLIAKGLTP